MIPTLATRQPLPALARTAPTTDFLLELGNGLLVRLTVAEILNQLTDALGELETGDLERIAALARAARERQISDRDKRHPTIVCLCGSTRFIDTFHKAEFEETLAGRIVLTVGCDTKSDAELFNGEDGARIKEMLDRLHKQKIELADEILVLNVGGYVGNSTKSEIIHAMTNNKRIRWLEPDSAEAIQAALARRQEG